MPAEAGIQFSLHARANQNWTPACAGVTVVLTTPWAVRILRAPRISPEFQELYLANIRSAKKRARQSLVNRERNVAQRSMYRTLIRNVVKAVQGKDKAKAQAAFLAMVPVLDRYASKGLIHKNKAARHKSRLSEQIKALP